MPTVTRKDLSRIVSEASGCSRAQADQAVQSVFEGLRRALVEGDRVEIRGFGALTVKDTRARPQARNPRTGEIVCVVARRKAHFRPGRHLKQALQ